MTILRHFYRNLILESVLLIAVCVQIISGLRLFKMHMNTVVSTFDKLHLWSGLYLAIFLVIHVSAILAGRFLLRLDTNFYFGAAGINTFPINVFFIPYYALAILSFFAHIAAVHSKKMKMNILGLSPATQAKSILAIGVLFILIIFYGLTNHFNGITIPAEYNVLIGK